MRIAPALTIAGFAIMGGDWAASPAFAAQPEPLPTPAAELAPPPRLLVPAIRLFPSPGGFQIALSRPTAELLRDTLDTAADEKQITKLLRENAKQKREKATNEDVTAAAKLELVAFLVSSQLPAFKKAMHERMGENGVVIQVMGLQRPTIFRKPRPVLERGLEIAGAVVSELTAEEVGRTIAAARAMAKTTPLSWSVLPQE